MIPTPYYLIDEERLLQNMRKIERLRALSGAKALLALKCFATWSAFPTMQPYMDGTTSSSLFELRLGREKFGKETHAYSVAYADHEIDEVVSHADKIIFSRVWKSIGPSTSTPRVSVRASPRSTRLCPTPTRSFSTPWGSCSATTANRRESNAVCALTRGFQRRVSIWPILRDPFRGWANGKWTRFLA